MSANNTNQPEPITLSLAEIAETYHRLHAIERALAAHELSPFHLLLLASAATNPDAAVGANARVLGTTATVISRGMDHLERRGLATRTRRNDEGGSPDRRQRFVHLTDQGRALLASLATLEVER